MIEQTPGDLTTQVIARAWKDEAFKAELLRDPKGVLERELAQLAPGAALPEQVQIHVLEETPTHRYLVLPPNPRIESGEELSDAELQQVASAGTRIATRRFDNDTHCYDF
jgi:hypothetical protein